MQKVKRLSAVLCLISVFSVSAFAGDTDCPVPPPPPSAQAVTSDTDFSASGQTANTVSRNSTETNGFGQALASYIPMLASMMDMF